MRKRLYFILPGLTSAHAVVDELLLARIDDKHIHVMARDDIDLSGLPEATLLQKSDIVHGVEMGMVIGGLCGLVGSLIVITVLQPVSIMGLVVLGCTIFGAGFGIWTAGMIGSSTHNTRLKEFEQAMDDGKILVMVDVPVAKIEAITHLVEAHKQSVIGGSEPSIPAFP